MTIDEYKKKAGRARFRRTKEEISLGLSPEEALARRVGNATPSTNTTKTVTKPTKNPTGEITIKIVPSADVDPDYLEEATVLGSVKVEQDNKFYGWIYEAINSKYKTPDNKEQFVVDLLEGGMDYVIRYLKTPTK